MDRRKFLISGGAALFGAVALFIALKGKTVFGFGEKQAVAGEFPLELSPQEWKQKLTEEEYKVLREQGTERAFTSPLNDEKRDGIFHCAGCGQGAYSSEHKFESGTGWPSFTQPLDGVDSKLVGTMEDNSLFMKRTEVHCGNCGGHHGHVFPDGPKPTGLRYCLNGVALDFRPA